ncbi:hypothetical protein [Streptomyces sp. ML-6]|uniref:hypothetical protein n=1 Tax=Streptomyces sp. ML-6 TaxID=2982693 RepID=UPI0024C0290E|nr:hypothetical protein [Streptomyces sp. ML-6]MDK0517708.1 hypothetical protein [Streptomyces sp. ML-6]
MSSPAVPGRSGRFAGVPGRAPALLAALAAVLLPAVFVVPHMLAADGSEDGFADQRNLIDTVGEEFVRYWNSGDRMFSPGMERVVDYWFRFHVVKAVIAAVLLIVVVALGVLLRKSFPRGGGAGPARRAAVATGRVVVTVLALFSSVIVVVNIQGAVAPFTSLLSMLPVGTRHGKLADTLDQVRQRLADSLTTGASPPPALDAMISDNSRYHVALAVTAAIVAVALVALSGVLWRRFLRTGPSGEHSRRALGACGVLTVALSLVVAVVAVANLSTASDSAQGLSVFFNGG